MKHQEALVIRTLSEAASNLYHINSEAERNQVLNQISVLLNTPVAPEQDQAGEPEASIDPRLERHNAIADFLNDRCVHCVVVEHILEGTTLPFTFLDILQDAEYELLELSQVPANDAVELIRKFIQEVVEGVNPVIEAKLLASKGDVSDELVAATERIAAFGVAAVEIRKQLVEKGHAQGDNAALTKVASVIELLARNISEIPRLKELEKTNPAAVEQYIRQRTAEMQEATAGVDLDKFKPRVVEIGSQEELEKFLGSLLKGE